MWVRLIGYVKKFPEERTIWFCKRSVIKDICGKRFIRNFDEEEAYLRKW